MNARVTSSPVERVLAALEKKGKPIEKGKDKGKKIRQVGPRQWEARCPGHDDHNPSLAIAEGKDGRALVFCHAGCSLKQILTPIGLKEADLFPSPPSGRKPKCLRSGVIKSQSWEIRDEAGNVVAVHHRRDWRTAASGCGGHEMANVASAASAPATCRCIACPTSWPRPTARRS